MARWFRLNHRATSRLYLRPRAALVAASEPIPEPLRRAAEHLDVCPECAEEFRACLAALTAEGGAG